MKGRRCGRSAHYLTAEGSESTENEAFIILAEDESPCAHMIRQPRERNS